VAAFHFHILTLFPEAFSEVLASSLLGKARERGLAEFHFTQIRDFAMDKHRSVDDTPYGGGEGMLLRPDVLHAAWKDAEAKTRSDGLRSRTILLSPQGALLTQEKAKRLANDYDRLVLVCGHYEGVDERFIELCVDEELSIGDYILTGGELPAMVLADAVTRLLPGVVGNEDSVANDSLEGGLLKYPQYTKPRAYEGKDVPEVLFSGNHGAIAKWRREKQVERTKAKRPDLFARLRSLVPGVVAAFALGLSGCQTSSLGSAAPKPGSREAKLIAQYDEDVVRAPRIQKEINSIFLAGSELRPSGWAFGETRLKELDQKLRASENPDVRYFLANREFFAQVPDSGGGFLIRANPKRLAPIASTKAGRLKLFQIEASQLRESIANPCFYDYEDCGDLTSDAVENEGLIQAFFRKHAGKTGGAYATEKRKVLREVTRELDVYAARPDWNPATREQVRAAVRDMIARLRRLPAE